VEEQEPGESRELKLRDGQEKEAQDRGKEVCCLLLNSATGVIFPSTSMAPPYRPVSTDLLKNFNDAEKVWLDQKIVIGTAS